MAPLRPAPPKKHGDALSPCFLSLPAPAVLPHPAGDISLPGALRPLLTGERSAPYGFSRS